MTHRNENHRSAKNKEESKTKFHIWRVVKLFSMYFLIFLSIFLWIDYYSYVIINPILLTLISIALGVIGTVIHIIRKKKTDIDYLVKKF